MPEWKDLSDDELEMRLMERDVPDYTARAVVEHRDDERVHEYIEHLLEGGE